MHECRVLCDRENAYKFKKTNIQMPLHLQNKFIMWKTYHVFIAVISFLCMILFHLFYLLALYSGMPEVFCLCVFFFESFVSLNLNSWTYSACGSIHNHWFYNIGKYWNVWCAKNDGSGGLRFHWINILVLSCLWMLMSFKWTAFG